MNRRTMLSTVLIALIGVPALPQPGFSQSDPFLGLWQLNIAKSKYNPGPSPKSQTWYIWEDEAKNRKNSQVTISANGIPSALVFTHIYDDKPHPVPGAQGYDSSAYARVDAHTIKSRYLKDGNAIATAIWTVSLDGNVLTYTATGSNASGQQVNVTAVYDKQ